MGQEEVADFWSTGIFDQSGSADQQLPESEGRPFGIDVNTNYGTGSSSAIPDIGVRFPDLADNDASLDLDGGEQ
jgi:hypothetical protein